MTTAKHSMIDDEGEVRELTSADLKHFRKAPGAFPESLRKKLGLLSERSESDCSFQKVAARITKDFEDDVKTASESLVCQAHR
jgi:hypothetical protein